MLAKQLRREGSVPDLETESDVWAAARLTAGRWDDVWSPVSPSPPNTWIMPPRCHTLLVTASPVAASVPIFAKFLPCEGRHCDDELITQGRGARQLLGLNNEDWIQDISLHFLAVCLESLGHPREATIATIATMHTCSHHKQQCR